MKKILLLIFMIGSCTFIMAQNKITGKINDGGGVPLQGASVYVPELNKGTISNANGQYELSNLPNGKLKIRFSYLGYSNHFEAIILNNNDMRLDIIMIPTAIESEEIVISGGYSSTQHENAVKIEVLKLGETSTKNTPNFMEMLTKVPGVDMISKGSGVSKPVIRGLSMNDVLVLNNGVRFENYQYSSHHPLGIDEFGVERVEVIKGPASLLYGSDAIGGILNFVKEKPASVGTLSGDYNLQLFSNTQGITNNIGLKAASKKFFGGIRFGHKSNADFLQGGGAFVPNSRFNEHSFKANAGFTDKFGTFKLFYDFGNQKLGLVEDEAIESIAERGRTNEIFYQALTTHLLSSQNKLYLGSFKLDVNTAYQSTELIHFGEPNVYEIQMKLNTLTYEAKLQLPSTNKAEYIVGFQGYDQTNSNLNDRETKLLPDASVQNNSAFALVQYDLFEKLKLQTGVRYDVKEIATQEVGNMQDTMSFRPAIQKNYQSLSGSLGATYNLKNDFWLRTNFAAAYRTPNLAELTSNGQHELRYEVGDQNLVPENSYEVDLSIHYHIDNFAFDLAGFYNKVNHYIYISPTGDTTSSGISVYKYRQANANLFGGEAGLHFHPEFAKWLHFETTFASVIAKQTNGEYLPFVPAHKVRFDIRVEREKLWGLHDAFASVNSLLAFDQNNPAPDETATNGYALFDLDFGARLKLDRFSFLVQLSINNLFDTSYIDHLSTLKEVALNNPGRNVALTIRIPFTVYQPK